MKSRGSLMKLTPALKPWLRPPSPDALHEKSFRNCHFCCCVCCGVLVFWPMLTPLGKEICGSRLLAVMALANSAYWNTISFSFDPPITKLWFTLNELNVLALSPQPLGGICG